MYVSDCSFILYFGILSNRKPKLPIEMEFRPADEEPTDKEPAAEGDSMEWDPQKLLEHAEMMTRLKEKIYEKAKVNIDEAQRKDKLYYDRKHSDPKEFSPDTLVLLKNSQRESKKGDKMKSRWLGPYLIHEVLGKGVYRLSNPETGVVLKTAVNQCRLKLYNEPPSRPSPEKPPSKKRKVWCW